MALLTCFALLPLTATAQMWPNETGPGGDLYASSSRQFDRLRPPPQANLPVASTTAMPMGAAPIPMLDWSPPPVAAPAPARAAPRRAVRRPVASPSEARASTPAPQPVAAAVPQPATPQPAVTAANTQEWERSLTERERSLDTLRRRLEEDRRLYDAQRGSAATGRAPMPASPR